MRVDTAVGATVEVAWPIRSRRCPPNQGYALFGALCRVGIVFHGQADTIVLPPGRFLCIRCPEDRAWRLAGSGLDRLDVAGRSVALGPPVVRPMVPSASLEAWCVTIKHATCDGSMRAACLAQLGRMGVACRVRVGPRRVIRIAGATIVGYGVRLDGLSPGESLRVQARGLGGRTRMGCGGFVPC